MTETLEHLRRRRETAESLLSVVKTMKGLAAGSIRDYERAAESLQQYASVVDLGFRILLKRAPHVLDPSRLEHEGPTSVIIIIGSDQGMVGRFNEEIAEYAHTHLQADSQQQAKHVIAVGQRLGTYLQAQGMQIDACVEQANSAPGIVRRVQEILGWLEDLLANEDDPRVLLVHHRPRSRGLYESNTRMLLPLDAFWLADIRSQPWPYRGVPAYSLSDHQLAQALIRQYLLVSLQQALAQSLAAEQAKRLAAMQAAEKNVLERIELLGARYREQRQAAITSELLEVTAGFSVLEGEKDRGHSESE